jgi:MYXO-CTERM domain-containing protein
VDFRAAGVASVQLRVAAQAATTLELHAESQTGPMLGRCQVAATGGAWATQTCALTETSGVGRLFVVFGGTVRLNWLKFQPANVGSGMGGASGGVGGQNGAGAGGAGAGAGGGGGAGNPGAGGMGDTGGLGGKIVLGGSGGASGGLGGDPGSSGAGGAASEKAGGGCSCGIGDAREPSGALLMVILGLGLVAAARRQR